MRKHIHLTEESNADRVSMSIGDGLLLPALSGLPWDQTNELVDKVTARNDALSRIAPGVAPRFGLLPFPLLDSSRGETRRVLDRLGLEGVCIVPIVGDRTLDDRQFIPLIEDLDRLGAQVLLHPSDTSGDPLGNPRYLDSMLTLARLLYYDRIRSMSRIKLILAHTCGVESFLAENIGMLHYLQSRRWRMGAFLADYLIRRRLRGVELVRGVEGCG